jgi:ribosome-binding protein aMBF1 (putative translation factor)
VSRRRAARDSARQARQGRRIRPTASDRCSSASQWQTANDIRTALGLTVTELAIRAHLTDDDIERIEEGGTEPTIPLLRRLAAALNADVRLTGGHDLGSVWFETHAA